MKSFNIIAFVVLISLFLSCENELADNLIPSNAYILESGETEIPVFRNNSSYEYPITINKSGLKHLDGTFKIVGGQTVLDEYNAKNGTDFRLISDEYFSLAENTFKLTQEDMKESTTLKMDLTKLKNLVPTNSTEYAIALKLVSENKEITISEDKQFLILIPRLTGGIRSESGVLLWEQSLEEMGIDQSNNNTVSMAVTEDYLFVNTRNADLRYFDRFTGQYVGTVELPFKGSLNNFSMASDGKSSIIISALRRGAAMTNQDLYRIDNTSAPVLFARVNHNISNGRKLSIKGDLNGNAIICSVVENEPNFVYWRTENGNIVSQNPEIFAANPLEIGWTLQADVYPLDLDLSKGVYMTGYGNASLSKFAFVDGVSKDVVYEYDLVGGEIDKSLQWATHSIDMITYNDAKYLALGSVTSSRMNARLLHVEDPSHISKNPLSPDLCKFITEFETEPNAQSTGDVLLAKSKNGEFLQMYVLATNGGVKVYQFDSKGDMTK